MLLIRHEALLEWRQKYAFSSVLVYVLSTVFVCYLSFKQINHVPTWNALFWVILLFTAVNTISKSFLQESRGRQLYVYLLASPQAVILARTVYNAGLTLLMWLICLGVYTLLIGNPVENQGLYLLTLALGSSGFAAVLTLMSAIAAQTNNNVTLMAILSFPILLPLLLTLITLSKQAADGLAWSVSSKYMIALLAINAIVCTLAYLLFPYLWRD